MGIRRSRNVAVGEEIVIGTSVGDRDGVRDVGGRLSSLSLLYVLDLGSSS